MSKILNYIVNNWKRNFSGTSALNVADTFKITHRDALAELKKLSDNGLIKINRVKLGKAASYKKIKIKDNPIFKIADKYKMVDTLMSFPKKEILEKVFKKEGKDYGIFSNRLHKGDSQLKHYYFKDEVLDKYIKYKDRYHFRDDSNGGHISSTTDFYFSLPENIRDEETLGCLDYGRFNLKNGGFGVGVIAKDLDSLSYKEQAYWHSFEIEDPQFAEDNRCWEGHISEMFFGNWDVDHKDLIVELTKVMQRINDKHPLFNKLSNPFLNIPVVNTYAAYINAHKELYKLFSSDNINKAILKGWLLHEGIEAKEFLNTGGKEKGQKGLFKMLFKNKNIDFTPFEINDKLRQEDAHHINSHVLPNANYPSVFRKDVDKLIEGLNGLC